MQPAGTGPSDSGSADPDRLLVAAASGDRRAFAALYDHLATPVHSVVLAVLRDPTMTEEVVQEVFVELWRTAARFDAGRGRARSWALTIAHRRAVDRVRSEQALRDRTNRVGAGEHSVPHDEVSELVEDRHQRARVRDALATLTPLQRESIELAYLHGHTYREVATTLDVPLETIRSRLRDGMRSLRTTLGVTP